VGAFLKLIFPPGGLQFKVKKHAGAIDEILLSNTERIDIAIATE
jgi:hypothetical protein